MTISMYQVSVPVFIQMLQNLSGFLTKAAAHAERLKIDSSVLLNSRLYPDMFSLLRQVQHASDTAKACPARLAGIDPPSFPDTESSLSELTERVAKTIGFLKSIKKEQIEGTEDKTIMYKHHGEILTFKGLPYLLNKALPTFFFHLTLAYAILRHNGVEIGKADYMGPL